MFLFLDRPPSLQSFWLSLVMSFLSWISSLQRRQEISTSFSFFLFEYKFSAFVLFKNLAIVLSVFPSLWQATIHDLSRLILISCKRGSMMFSRSFLSFLGVRDTWKVQAFPPCILFQFLMLCFKLYKFATHSLESLLQNFWGVFCHWTRTSLLTLHFYFFW